MMRCTGIYCCWTGAACFVIAMAGCGKPTPTVAPAGSAGSESPQVAESAPATLPESMTEAAEPEVTRPAAEPTALESSATTEQPQPAVAEPRPQPPKAEPPQVAAPAEPSSAGPGKKPKVALSVPPPPDYIYEPEVAMSQQHANSCLVKVGDSFPVGQLPDLDDQQRTLPELFGEKLTVVVLWSNNNRFGREQIQRLQAETVVPFENAGMQVVAININDSPEQIREILPSISEVGFTILRDPDAAFFSQVATAGLPRTYLLDASGKVLWLDIEYSRSMARNLANAIHVYLGGEKTREILESQKSGDS